MNFLITGSMKMLKYIIFYSLFLLTSCGPESSCETYKYTVRNESGVDIEITGYNSIRNNTKSFFYEFKNNEELTKSYKNCPPGEVPYYSFNIFFESDSIKVILNSNKKLLFKREIVCDSNSQRNPLNECMYNSIKNINEIFTFTVQDYENADDCNGNCE